MTNRGSRQKQRRTHPALVAALITVAALALAMFIVPGWAAAQPGTPTSTGKRPIQIEPSSIAGWSIEEGTAKKKVGRIGPTDASIPQARWQFTINTLATRFSSGLSVLTPATNYFTVAENGRVSYTGANPRVAGRTYTGMGTAFLTITISDSKEKADDLRVTIPIAMQAQPTLTAVASSITGWTVQDGTESKKVGKIGLNEIRNNRAEFALDRVTSEISGQFTGQITGQITIDESTGIISYDGKALVASGDTAFYPHDIDLDVTVKDKKGKFADGALEITITVNEPFKPSITALGAPYNSWEITVGEKSNDIGRIYALGDPPLARQASALHAAQLRRRGPARLLRQQENRHSQLQAEQGPAALPRGNLRRQAAHIDPTPDRSLTPGRPCGDDHGDRQRECQSPW